MTTINKLDEKKVKKTLARISILAIFKKIEKPISVDELILKLSKMGTKVNRSTVFRNVNILVQKGFINRVELDEGKFRYESSFLPHHHHLVCKKCQNIIDLKSDLFHEQIDKLSKKVSKLYGFKIKDHKVEFFGSCKSCGNTS